MTTAKPWRRFIDQWRSAGVPIRAGVSADAIAKFEQRYEVVLPPTVAAYWSAVDGTGIDESDDELTCFFPLEDVRPVDEVLDDSGGVLYSDRFAYPSCYVFADYCMSCWLYAVKLTNDPNQAAPVFRVTASEPKGEQIAASFLEFMTQYSRDPGSIL